MRSSHNEHVASQKLAQGKTLDYSNIVASCNTQKQCGKAHGHADLPLTPLMDDCETELEFRLNGKVVGLTPRARQAIDILNIGDENISLKAARKCAIDALIYSKGESPGSIAFLGDDLLDVLLEELQQDGCECLAPYQPVLANALKVLINI